jgi:hypothetical protein
MSADERTMAKRVEYVADQLERYCEGSPDDVAALLREQQARIAQLEQATDIAIEINNEHQQRETEMQAEIERLTTALKKQAASALMGMDAAKAIAASNVREAARLYAESNPSAIDSERTANQLLTDEIDSLRRDLSAVNAAHDKLLGEHIAVMDERNQLRRDLDAARVDAERYRYWRAVHVRDPKAHWVFLAAMVRADNEREIDAAIDAARARGEGNDD